MNIVFWGNSDFSLKPLEALKRHFSISAVVTAPDTFVGRGMKTPRLNPVKKFAEEHQIPLLQPEKLKNNGLFLAELKQFPADLFVLVSYGKMVPASIFTLPPRGMINLHASLLPKLRGASPIQFALWQGLEETGNTVQYIVEGMDEGGILAQRPLPVLEADDYFSLQDRLAADGADLLVETVRDLGQGKAAPQDHEAATYCSLITKEDGIVDFDMTAEEIMRAYKALKHFPGICLSLSCGMLKILDCSPAEGSGKKGEILSISAEGMLLSCFEDALLIKTVQAPGKKACSARDFANGMRLKPGSLLV